MTILKKCIRGGVGAFWILASGLVLLAESICDLILTAFRPRFTEKMLSRLQEGIFVRTPAKDIQYIEIDSIEFDVYSFWSPSAIRIYFRLADEQKPYLRLYPGSNAGPNVTLRETIPYQEQDIQYSFTFSSKRSVQKNISELQSWVSRPR